MEEKSLLNRYVRYIYRKMMAIHGKDKVREEALRIYIITTKEKTRIVKEKTSTFSDVFKEGLMQLLKGWGIRAPFINESICVLDSEEGLLQTLKDLTPLRIRIRKLTPKECMRLQAVSDEDYEKMKATGLSNSALYKLAGNSICLAPMEGIFTQLFRADSDALF